MDTGDILRQVDHTLLSQTAAWDQIKKLCDEAVTFHTASVCIPPSYVKRVKEYVKDEMAVCTVIGFPNGYQTGEVKAFETKEALRDGADEIDMVINLGDVKNRDYYKILDEIKMIKDICGEKILKVIIETCLLDMGEKEALCRIVTESGADYIKTSTGFSTAGATLSDVAVLRKKTGENVKVKAAGGISSLEDAVSFLESGADRLGTSRMIQLIEHPGVMDIGEQICKTEEMLARSYSPYSGFRVAAGLLTRTGRLYLGCNVENAAWSPSSCAERNAFFKAVGDGEREFESIVIMGGPDGGSLEYCPPCGVCRQVMSEFCNPRQFKIILAKSKKEYQVYTQEELFPMSFGPENLKPPSTEKG